MYETIYFYKEPENNIIDFVHLTLTRHAARNPR